MSIDELFTTAEKARIRDTESTFSNRPPGVDLVDRLDLLIAQVNAEFAAQTAAAAFAKGLQTLYVGPGTARIAAGCIPSRDGLGTLIELDSPIDLTFADLDTGPEANALYHLHLFGSATDPTVGRLSASFDTPGVPPGDYSLGRSNRVGSVHNDSGLDLIPWFMAGDGPNRWVTYDASGGPTEVLTNGTSTIDVVVDCSAFVPRSSTYMRYRWDYNPDVQGAVAHIRPDGAVALIGEVHQLAIAPVLDARHHNHTALSALQRIIYRISAGSSPLCVIVRSYQEILT